MPLCQTVSDLDLRNLNQKLLIYQKITAMRLWKQPPNVPWITDLQIKRCPDLKNFSEVSKEVGMLLHLKQQMIDRCDALTSIASEFRYLTSPKHLEIPSCKVLDVSDYGSHDMDNTDMASWIPLRTLTEFDTWRHPLDILEKLLPFGRQ